MLPGPELDAEVARKVFGVVVILDTENLTYRCTDRDLNKFVQVPTYSTDTTTAYKIVQHFKGLGCTFSMSALDDATYNVTISHPQIPGVNISSNGNTMAHAICLAILQFYKLFKVIKK